MRSPLPARTIAASAVLLLLLRLAITVPAAKGADNLLAVAGDLKIPGGLCVQLGCDDLEPLVPLVRTGNYLVQVLDSREDAVSKARSDVYGQGLYGLLSVVQRSPREALPYAENLVNIVVVPADLADKATISEIARVLCPGGVVLWQGNVDAVDFGQVGIEPLQNAGGWHAARKPWPAAMDGWTHPRHAADGNAVSQDTAVGPPRRVRWVAGPSVEISNMVTAAGRNYYGGVWTRDAFNGLRLWQRSLSPSPARGGFSFQYQAGSVRPVAAGDRLIVVTDGAVTALDGRTGELLCTYAEAGKPAELLVVGDTLLTIDAATVRAVAMQKGDLRWKYDAAEPRYVVASDDAVFLMEGSPRRGEKPVAVSLAMVDGSVRWKQSEYAWLPAVRRSVIHGDRIALEVSTLNDTKEGNSIQVLSAGDGNLLFSRDFVPSMNHMKQARAMFIDDLLWLLEDRQCVAVDATTGEVKKTYKAGLCHCFPPVATRRFIFSGEMEMTDLATGEMDANRITKAACGRDVGWVPANGLVNVTPKHCVCWPMLRGYAAMAGESRVEGQESRAGKGEESGKERLERGPAYPGVGSPRDLPGSRLSTLDSPLSSWPCYRHDAWRSGSTTMELPRELAVLWTASLGDWPEGTIVEDWRENPFVHGPITAPVVAGGLAVVARPDAHEVVALDAVTGKPRWRFTADGRVDTPPTLDRGLCLFGSKSGSVYALRAEDGQPAWRFRAAGSDEQIVAYGQVESPWPVPGSVLVVDDTAYFAAGRQPLADGGIRIFAVEPATGAVRWEKRLDTVPTQNFYGSSGLEYDNFDLLHRENGSVAMSRWLFDAKTGEMTCKALDAFAMLAGDGFDAVVPRSCWSYAPRHQPRHGGNASGMRHLAVYQGNRVLGVLRDERSVFRRDFDPQSREKFNTRWLTGWATSENFRKKDGDVWQSDRLAAGAMWQSAVFDESEPKQTIAALLLAGDTLLAAGSEGGLTAVSVVDGKLLAKTDLPAPLWDGMAAAADRLFVSTRDGKLICFGVGAG
ncbi:MAG: PQQ-binding-like beta-propeller repeat protein [Rhodopirellula sp.]|mgnify:CR=1 FL=1|nr:PQQ-binding-like beta-propeller repeat protein [Rhodopirellula sp.]